MSSSILLSDNGASSGSAGLKSTAGNDGVLILQTTTSGGTATNAVYIDTSQNVGIGTSSPSTRLHVAGATTATSQVTTQHTGSSITTIFGCDGSIDVGAVYVTTNHPLAFRTNNTERMRIDSSGNVGIGTSSPAFPLDVQSTGVGSTIAGRIYRSDGTIALLRIGNSTSGSASSAPAFGSDTTAAVVYTNNTERARIDSSGNFLFMGKTNTNVTDPGVVIENNVTYGRVNFTKGSASGTGTTYACGFYYNGTQVGSIGNTSTATSFNTSSDYRLKENIAPMTGALSVVAALKPVTYNWKSDGSEGQGFIAHELQEVCPSAVTGEKDAVNEDGSIKPQGIDTSFLVATLTAAIQEQQALITTLTERITALEAK